jgi:hypothetical protein
VAQARAIQSKRKKNSRMLKRLIYFVMAAFTGGLATFSLWGTIYWYWESTNAPSAEEARAASYDAHAWFFYLCIFGVVSSVFWVLFFLSMSRPLQDDGRVA